MFGGHNEELIDKASMLERLRKEVGCLADNLSAMTHHPDGLFKISATHKLPLSPLQLD